MATHRFSENHYVALIVLLFRRVHRLALGALIQATALCGKHTAIKHRRETRQSAWKPRAKTHRG